MIVAGFGCRSGAGAASFDAALVNAAGTLPVAALAVPADRAPLLAALAARLGVPLIPVDGARLAATPTPTRSPASLAARGTGSVAEAAALAAAGPGAALLVTRRIAPDGMATCAIARSNPAKDPAP